MSILLTAAFLAGLLHVLAGPDHLAAVAPLAVGNREGGWRTGMRWGIGHCAGMAFVGAAAILLREALPVAMISGWSERLVGAVLICIGLWSVQNAFRVHAHEHVHDGERHVHLHAHSPGEDHKRPAAHRHGHAAFGVGALHGLAGSSHFLGILPALALPSMFSAGAYLGAFAIGTVVAMAAFAGLVGRIAVRFSGAAAYRAVMLSCATAAVGVGALWLVS